MTSSKFHTVSIQIIVKNISQKMVGETFGAAASMTDTRTAVQATVEHKLLLVLPTAACRIESFCLYHLYGRLVEGLLLRYQFLTAQPSLCWYTVANTMLRNARKAPRDITRTPSLRAMPSTPSTGMCVTSSRRSMDMSAESTVKSRLTNLAGTCWAGGI